MNEISPTQSALADDLLTGVPAIAAHIGWPKRRVYYCLERGHLPAQKVGALWIASKQRLRERLTGVEG